MNKKSLPLQKEWLKLVRQEQIYLQKRMEKTDSKINKLLADKVPKNLQTTLDTAFAKAFFAVFEKGTTVIEKTYRKEELEQNYQINEYAAKVRGNRKALKAFSKKAKGAGNLNLLISGVSGIGLGVLGIGIPDIVLFTGLLLKGVYEIALNYGFAYESEAEKKFILYLVQGALSYGKELEVINDELNLFMENGTFVREHSLKQCIEETAGCLSKELLYMKFLQGIPLVGAAGGAYDAIYMRQIVKYAELKYRRRFYLKYGNTTDVV